MPAWLRWCVWIALMLAARAASARGASVTHDLARALADLDARHVPTGILLDRVVSLSPIRDHDGRPGSPPVSLRAWRQMEDEMRRASSRPWPAPARCAGWRPRARSSPAR